MKCRPQIIPAAVLIWGCLFAVFESRAFSTMEQECEINLRTIDGALHQWAVENRIYTSSTNLVSLSDTNVLAYFPGQQLPVCGRGGVYLAGPTVDAGPRCTFHGTIQDITNEHNRGMVRQQRFAKILPVIAGCAIVIIAFVAYYFIGKPIVRRFRTENLS